MHYRYRIPEQCEESTYLMFSDWKEDDLGWIAEDAAVDWFNNHDGYESSWPLEFQILRMDGTEIGRFIVDMQPVPAFSATPKK